MKKYLFPSIKMTLVMLLICCIIYFGIVSAIGMMTPGHGSGEKIVSGGKTVGYILLGQKFTDDKYFWGRPSAVDYNAGGSGGSNKGTSNPEYLKIVQQRIDSFLVHNPGIRKSDIPAEMVTASASGLDPHISPESAIIQTKRIASVRKIDEQKLRVLVNQQTRNPLFGPSTVNVLQLNIAIDEIK